MSNKNLLKLWLRNVTSALWRIADTPLPRLHKWLPWDVTLVYAVMLMGVVLLLSACRTLPSKPCEKPAPVMMPALSEPLPSVNYSLSAQQDIESWAKKLRAMSPTSKP